MILAEYRALLYQVCSHAKIKIRLSSNHWPWSVCHFSCFLVCSSFDGIMPYGLGFNHHDINARCNRQFGKVADNHSHTSVKKKLKLAGLKVLKQKKAANEFLSQGGNFSETDRGKETIVQMDNCKKGFDTRVIGGRQYEIMLKLLCGWMRCWNERAYLLSWGTKIMVMIIWWSFHNQIKSKTKLFRIWLLESSKHEIRSLK